MTRKIFAGILVLVVVGGAYYLGRRSVKPIRLIEERIIERVKEIGVPVPYVVTLPGTRVEVPVVIERVREIVKEKPVEKIVVKAPPVPCLTEEECKRIFGQAEQSIEVTGAIRAGTVVPVLLGTQTTNLPLADDFRLRVRLALAERGAFVALQPAGDPLRIDQVETRTQINIREQPNRLPYNLGLEVGVLGSTAYAGAVYQNQLGPGYYRVTAGYGFSVTAGAGPVFGASFILPLR